MIDDRFGNPPGSRLPEGDPNRLYPDADYGRSNASVGLIVGAVVVLGVMIYAFGWKADDQTADSSPPAVTTGQSTERPNPTPGPIGPTAAPSVTPAPAPSTTGSGTTQ